MMMANNNKVTEDDIEAAPIASSLRPRLNRGDAAHQPSPLVIAAYTVLKSSDGEASLEEVSLKEALDGGGSSCNEKLETEKQEESLLTEQQPQQQQQQLQLQVSQKQYWIDVEILEQHNSDRLESAFSKVKESILDKLLFEDNPSCRLLRRHLQKENELQTPQVLVLRHAALLVVRVLGEGDVFGVRHAAAVCLPHIVVTITSSSSAETSSSSSSGDSTSGRRHGSSLTSSLDSVRTGIGPKHESHRRLSLIVAPHQDTLMYILERELHDASVSGCILMWLEFHLNRTQCKAHHLRRKLFQLVERASTNPTDVCYTDIANCRDELLKLSSVAEEQNECMEAMEQGEYKSMAFNSNSMQGSMNVLKQSAGATERLMLRLEKRLDDLKQGYDAHQQNRINHRLNVLTMFSAIFLPLTLMAGIYGMNFSNMPELYTQNGYYWLLASMACVASVLMFFFYSRGWLS